MTGVRYIRPRSLTWWAGVAMIAVGIAGIILPDSDAAREVAVALHMLTGEGASSPGMMIGSGLGLIGLRDAIQRAVGDG